MHIYRWDNTSAETSEDQRFSESATTSVAD